MTVPTKKLLLSYYSQRGEYCKPLIFNGFAAMFEVGSGPKPLACHASWPFAITPVSFLSSLPILPGGHTRPLAATKSGHKVTTGRNEGNKKDWSMPTEKIPEPRFVLKYTRNARKETPILMFVHYTSTAGQKKRVQLSTGKKVRAEHWDKGQMMVKPITSTLPFRDEINARIAQYREAAIEVWKAVGRDVSPEHYRRAFFRYIEEQASEEARQAARMGFPEFLDYYALEAHAGNVNKHRCRRLLLLYRQDSGAPFTFNAFDAAWASEFKKWLFSARPAIGKDALSQNYVSRVLETFRGILNAAHEKGLHKNLEFKDSAFSEGKAQSVKVALTPLETEHFHHFDFGSDTRLDKARNIFLASCYTGLRWSDITRLRPHHISEVPDGFVVSIPNFKTGKVTTSPADARLAEIIERMGGQVPAVSNQRLNLYVKEACQAAGLSRPILVCAKPEQWQPLHEVVTFHDSRITWATQMYREGYAVDRIRKYMGHKKLGTTEGYILSEEVDAKERVSQEMAMHKRKRDEDGKLRKAK